MPHESGMDVDEFEGFSRTSNFIQRQYRGLRSEESDVLRAYIKDQGTSGLKRLRTSWPVGEGETPAFADPDLRQLGQDLSKWKIDAVLDWSGRTEIVELKSRATHTAAGQVLFYSFALAEEPEERSTHRLSVVAFRAHPDLERLIGRTPIQLHTVPDADMSTATKRALVDRLRKGDVQNVP